ncbi:MAG: metalloregulator ArsR/SmtB family transcription factor [Nitrososphaeraceae archaeon]
MESPWKALSDDSRRQILFLLKEKDSTPTEIAKHFQFTLPAVSAHLRILKNSDLVTENKIGKNRIYSLNKEKTLEMMRFFAEMWDYNLKSLKESIENQHYKKSRNEKK